MFETLSDRRRRIEQLYDETKWPYIWLLFSTGVLLFLALCVSRFPDSGSPFRTSSQTDVILITDQLSPACDPRHNSVAGGKLCGHLR
jgi:hypothetical protein